MSLSRILPEVYGFHHRFFFLAFNQNNQNSGLNVLILTLWQFSLHLERNKHILHVSHKQPREQSTAKAMKHPASSVKKQDFNTKTQWGKMNVRIKKRILINALHFWCKCCFFTILLFIKQQRNVKFLSVTWSARSAFYSASHSLNMFNSSEN